MINSVYMKFLELLHSSKKQTDYTRSTELQSESIIVT